MEKTQQDLSLLEAAIMNNSDLLTEAIENGANVNIQDDYGMTPLMHSVAHSSLDNVEILLENGADVRLEDSRGHNAYFFISEECLTSMTQLLKRYDLKIQYKKKLNSNHFGVL